MHGLRPPELFQCEAVPGGQLVRFTCRTLDETNAQNLAAPLLALAPAHGAGSLYLDLGAVELLSSAVLGQLIVLHRRLRDAGGQLSLFNLQPLVCAVLKMSLLTDLLDIRVIPLPRKGA